ncbi:HPF/RaiA family ribosome-associated protein [Saccharothrix sp. BKS2]|uniref:HPF/RaiA family ribosome-associated protein n=1 Tax=Saccharothrix sp. BKS2 TaxID=3064400 RepID=UPI0039EA7791
MRDTPEGDTVIAQRLQLATGFHVSERHWVVGHLDALGTRLRSFRADQIDLEVSLKDREGVGQRVTLECWINRTPRLHLVATSSRRDLTAALGEVRDDLVRQVDQAKTRTEPRSNRALRVLPDLPERE